MSANCALDSALSLEALSNAAGQGRCRLRAVVIDACSVCPACQTVNALVSSKSWFCVEVNERHCTCLSRPHRGVWLSYQHQRIKSHNS